MTTWSEFLERPWLFAIAAVVLVIGSGRIVRLLTHDDFPPSEWFRQTWTNITKGGAWGKIAFCLWCMSPYVVAFSLIWLWVGLVWVPWLTIAWWILFGWMALSYLTSLFVFWDEGNPRDD